MVQCRFVAEAGSITYAQACQPLFIPYVQQDLLDSGESYESYCVNIFNGKVWGDDFILSALGHMFNIAITIISPCFDNQLDLFHTKEIPDVVVIANGGDYITGR